MKKCPLCQTPSPSFRDRQLDCLTYHCPHCELLFKEENAHPSEAQERKKYDEHNNSIENEGYVAMFEAFIDYTLAAVDRPVKRVLDFGSGPAPVLAELLRRRGFEVTIYDKYFAPEPPAEDARFDLITSTEVIEHIADPMGTLAELNARLVPGGTLALMTQFHQNSEAFYQNWWYRRDPTHLVFFTPRSFEIAAERLQMKRICHDGKKIVLLSKAL
ncbi:class I SAM-dependent methyltransferase [Sulfurimonas sp. HSL-3221]|uniref:Class I SAM-dependent methyltransferase n=1 Tax=Sulfurimonas diazotrophicus TaxID=3131939 RepID=A0ABZ3HBQ3_9BACT|nr:class I SAM-dependent methyltransferase [Sulfurimonas sp. HSL-3221]UFS63419.1 class I SAM-dependent methyltransferase [Sulfurimonas sp. HSL-3221]